MSELPEREWLDKAKEMLRAKLLDHPDEGVRLLAHDAEFSDNHPEVRAIALALLEKDSRDGCGIGFGH